MRSATFMRSALYAAAMILAVSSAANATGGVARTWVASTGNDSNTATNCTRTAPCKTFASAYSVTAPGGEIVALDSVGYGPINITTSVTIIGLEGALISVQSNTVGVTIGAGSSDVVILKNIQISGAAGSTNTKGIQLNSGRLFLQNSSVRSLTSGLSVSSSHATVTDSEFVGNTTGIETTGTGVDQNSSFPVTGVTWVMLERVNAVFNTTAFVMHDPGTASGANRITIWSRNMGSTVTLFHVGNGTVISGDGPSCSGLCTQYGQYTQQTGFTWN